MPFRLITLRVWPVTQSRSLSHIAESRAPRVGMRLTIDINDQRRSMIIVEGRLVCVLRSGSCSEPIKMFFCIPTSRKDTSLSAVFDDVCSEKVVVATPPPAVFEPRLPEHEAAERLRGLRNLVQENKLDY